MSGVLGLFGAGVLAPHSASAGGCTPAPPGLIGWWAGEGNASDTLGLDSGTASNVTFVAGQVGQSFLFNGTNAYVQIPDSSLLSSHLGPQGEISLEAWVLMPRLPQFDTTTSQANRAVVVKGSPSAWEYGFEIQTNGAPYFALWQLNGSAYSVASSTNALTLGAWHHLVGTLRKGVFCRLYVDGQLAAESTSFSGDTGDGGSPLYIGRRGDGQYFDGQVDEVSDYIRALTAGEVAGLFNAGSAGKCASIAGARVPYFTDFETGVGPEWSDATRSTDGSFSLFSGRFGNQFQRLIVTNLVVGQTYTLGFDFYAIDTWDGNNGGPDYFNVAVNGAQVFHQTFANYAPPSAQSFPRVPDEGWANFGFRSEYTDAIYRNVEIAFVATNPITTFAFSGQNLEAIDNESWGIDNVSVRLSADLTNTFVRSTTLPVAGSTNSISLDAFTISANQPLLPASATNTANYVLREAGADRLFGTADDVIIPLVPTLPGAGGRSVAFTFANAPLQPGFYRFETGAGLLDTNSVPVPPFQLAFTIANPILGAIENTSNDTLATATPLPVAESPAGSAFFTAFAVGNFASSSDVDYWRFDAEAGDVITVRLECQSLGVYPQVYLQNASGGNVGTWSQGDYWTGSVGFQNVTIGTPGTYYLRVFSNNNRSRYWMRLDQSRGPQMEAESNDSQSAANQLALTFTQSQAQGRVVGSLPAVDTAGDYYRLGTLNVGNSISVTALYPTGALLNASQTLLSIQLDGNPIALATNRTGNLNYSVASNGVYYVHVETTNANLRAQYLLNVTIVDGVPPVVTGTSLPADGGTTTEVLDRFSLTFSEDVYAPAANNSTNYEMRGAGPDGLFGTADDTFYTVVNNGYTSGLTASYSITDGPLQPGSYQFTVSTNLVDRANNPMSQPFVRKFTVANLAGYVLEGRNNGDGGLATRLSSTPATNGDGTVGHISDVGTPSQPEGITAGRFNSNVDTNLDVATANWSSGNVTIYTNNGTGTLTAAASFGTGNNPIGVANGDFNGDGKADLAVANYNSSTISILTGDGNAGFILVTNLTGFSNPYGIVVADVNNDGKPDVVVPNYGNGTMSVVLGNGDGTFQTRTNYTAGSNPAGVAVGDLNNDGLPDIAVANYNSGTVSVFTNAGNGGFVLATNVPCGPNPRSVAIADVTGDGKPDLVTVQSGDNSVSVMAGNGDGTFQGRKYFYGGFTNPYQLLLADLNGDGRLDVVVPGYGNNTIAILLNNGAGVFTNFYTYGAGGNPIGAVSGDFNGDGRPDIAFCHYYGNYVSIWAGSGASLLVEDPPGSGLRSVFGRGRRSNSSDVDFYQFSGNVGDQCMVAVDTPGNPGASSLYYQVMRLDGSVLTSFYSSGNGWTQSGIVTLPQTGTYLLRVAGNNDYQGEYRFRITLARPPVQLSGEGNTSIGAALAMGLTLTNVNHLTGSIAGYLSVGDGADYYSFGNLLGGTTININFNQPASSGIAEILSIYGPTGALLTNSLPGVTNFAFTVPPGSNGVYYAGISAGQASYTAGAGTAISLNGNSAFVDLGGWSPGPQWTLQAWVNPYSLPGGRHNILGAAAQCLDWGLDLQDGQFAINLTPPGSCNTQYRSGDPVTPGQWYQLTATCDGTNASLYINGQLRVTGPVQNNYVGTAQGTRMGGDSCCGDYFPGMMREVRVWNRPLTAGEITTGLYSTLTGSEPNLVGYWPCNEGAGTTTADLSTFNRTGNFNNGAAWVNLGPTNAIAPSLRSQYLLSFDLTCATPPVITSVSLPANATTNAGIFSSFTVGFNEDLDPRFTWMSRSIYRFNGHSYLLTDSASDWRSCENAAITLGGHLASITSAAENTFINQTFSGAGNLWLGFNMFGAGGGWAWSFGDPVTYQNWAGGAPNNSGGYEFGVQFQTDGTWQDVSYGTSLRGVIEVTNTADTDADGLVTGLDPYPNDPKNAFDLRAAGPDGLFDTPDDILYRIYSTGYASGLATSFAIADGPLQPGNYRFQVTTALNDRFGNTLPATYNQYFAIAPVSGLIAENRRTNGVSVTSLSLAVSNQLDGSFVVTSSTGVGAQPYCIAQGDFNGDGYLDVVTANWNAGGIYVLTNDTTGRFVIATNIATGNNPDSVVAADLNGDGKLDLAVANWSSGTVTILLGNGAAGFALATNLPGFTNPWNLTAADFNRDGIPDLAVPSYNGGRITVLLGDGTGNFTNSANYTVGSNPETVRAGDLNGDGNPDLVTANYGSANFTVLLGASNGTFTVTTNYSTPSNPRYTLLADVNGDGKLDAVTVNNGSYLSVAFGNGDGTFQPRTDYNTGSGDTYQVLAADINSDGKPDLVIPGYGANRVYTFLNNGDGTFGSLFSYANVGGNPIGVAAGDYNRDGLLDLAVCTWNGSSVVVMLGNNTESLVPDPAGTGMSVAAGRGNLADGSDLDYWTFSAQAGDRMLVAVETPGNPGGAGLLYRFYYPDGSQWTYFYSDGNGRGQLNGVIPVSGTYTIRVEPNNQFYGEYRLRVTLAKAPLQMEAEDNSSLNNANSLTFALSAGHQRATVAGYIGNADGSGDFYRLGNLSAGTRINLSFARPASSGLMEALFLYNAAGNIVAYSQAGATNFSYDIPPGGDGAYYAQVWDAGPVAALSFGGTNGYALRLDGGSMWVNFTNAVIPTSGDFTVEAWAYATASDGNYHDILSQGSGGNAFYMGYRSWMARAGDGWEYISTLPWPIGGWHHFAVVKSSTNTLYYVDGALAANKGGTIPNPAASTPLRFGRQYGNYGEYWGGDIDEVRIWNVARTASDIAANMTNQLTGAEAGLVGYWRFDEGTNSTVFDATASGNNGTFQSYPVWVPSTFTNAQPSSIFSQYILGIDLADTQPPYIVSDTLPAEASTNSGIVDRFSMTFNKDMGAPTVTNSANYELRCAGPDGLFGTADDALYPILNTPAYSSGLSASYLIQTGPLQPGRYRFTVSTNLTDRPGNNLTNAYVRTFTMVNVPGFVLENRTNNSFTTATSLSLVRSNSADGSLAGGPSLGLGSGTERIAAGRLNGDTNMDLVAALWQSGGVAVLLGNGDGSFTVKTNYSTGSQAWSVALGNFDADTNLDLAVVNYGANTVSIFTGNGDGTFQFRTNYSVGAQPYHVVVGDFNNDGKADLAIPNYNSAKVSILLGNGDGTFQPAVNYSVGSQPMYAAVADVNGDGKPDLLIANYNDNNVSLLFGKGDGTFAAAVGLAAGSHPRALAVADLNNDGKLDLAVFNGGDNTISVMFGNGDGSFQTRANYAASTSDGYELLATDLNADGWRDLVVDGYNNSTVNVLLNRGDGTFQSPSTYSFGNRPVGLAAADFNNDGRLDIAVGNDSGQSVSVLLGNDTETLPTDTSLSGMRISAGRGNLTDSGDVNYWSFSAQADDRISIATETPGSPGGSSLLYRVYLPNGNQWTYFYSDTYGRAQFNNVIPVSGTYWVRAEANNGYVGEYRLRLTLTRPPVQLEAEGNDSIANANTLSFVSSAGHQTATVLGCINTGDPGDYYQLGNLSSNTVITLGVQQPASSGFAHKFEIYNAAGTLATNSPIAPASFGYTVPTGGDGAYYARIYSVMAPSPRHVTGSANTLYYDGGNDYSEALVVMPAAAATVTFWFRTLDPNAGLFSVSDGGGSHDRHVYLNGGNIYTRIYSAGGIGSSGLNLADGAWHFVAFTYGSAIGGNQTYVDGVLVLSGTKASSDFNWQNRIRMGYSQDAPHQYLNGYLDEVRLWNFAFAPTNVLANMTNSLTGSESGLIGYWRFNEGVGTTSLDLTTNAHNATFISGPTWAQESSYHLAGASIFAQYLLTLDLADTLTPAVTSVTLPTSGATNLSIIDRFTLGFNKDIDPSINLVNRFIRTYGGHAYTVTPGTTTWYDAETQARAFAGHLVTINDTLENVWVYGTFSPFGNVWIGLTDEALKGTYAWASGESLGYTNWDSGQPNNNNNQDYVVMRGGGLWADYAMNSNLRGVIEVAGPDSDGDGIPDTLDPFPYDPLNLVDLRAAGPDGLFDTPDDVSYHLSTDNYVSGLSLNFYLTDGPLQPGKYRFTVTGSLRDRFGNGLAVPVVQYFTIGDVPGYVMSGRNNKTAATATPLALTEDPPSRRSGAGRGKLFDGNDVDYWSFPGTNGDLLTLGVEVPGNPNGGRLHYEVFQPNGNRIVDLVPTYNGSFGQGSPVSLPTNGTYIVRVTPYDGYYGEYHLRLTTVTPPIQMETEENGSLAAANPLTYTVSTNLQTASLAGYVRNASDLDYYNLGTVSNGYSIFLNTRLPAGSTLLPVVSVYNSANSYQAEAPGGRPDDGVAEIRVTQTGTYYALVRGGQGTGGLDSQYILDVQVVPTGTVSFPNLQVVAVNPPTGSGVLSGQPITYSYTVQNVGSASTIVGNWVDRAALSTDTVLGNADDIPLGFFPHAGVLNPGDSYSVTNTFTLPDGIGGDYYLIVFTDAGNAVSEFLFEGDNTTVSGSTFHISVAPYPDLRVENLSVIGPDATNAFTITWNTANRGNATAPAGFHERLQIRNLTSGASLLNTEQVIPGSLAPNATLPHLATVVTTNAGVYQVQVTTDSRDEIFEYDGISHASAEANNTGITNFSIIAYFNVTVQSIPPGAGTLTGAGSYTSGSSVQVTAVPNTNTLPYQFVNWTEGGTFQSANTNYTFLISRDRALVANFTLPTFQIAASNNPPLGGTVSGQGTYFYGTTNVLSANAGSGYRFTNWTENGSVIATTPLFTNVVTSNRFLVANYSEANTFHLVSTATSPTNLATITGAGTYTNGQTGTFTAPAGITNPPFRYAFREFRLNGSMVGNNATFTKTFSTLDQTNLQYIAYYDTYSILPVITQVIPGVTNPVLGGFTIITNPVGAMTNYQITLTFDRSMNPATNPAVVITNSGAAVQPVVPAGGTWFASAFPSDTFRTPFITFSNGMDGPAVVTVSGAVDPQGLLLQSTNVAALVIDVTPPPAPTLMLIASNNSSATVNWSAYSPTPDLASFRLYLGTNSALGTSNLVSAVGSGTRSYTFYGLSLDRPYYAAISAQDVANNTSPLGPTLPFILPSATPPPVPIQVAATGPAAAGISWNTYDTSVLLGFAGFKLYYESIPFTSVASLTPKQNLGPGIRSVAVSNLDRTKTWYFAVVGYNVNGVFNSSVTPATWSDPYAGSISANLTIGGSGLSQVDILQSITVINNAVVTIPAGTTLRFAPGASLTVQQGALNAVGTALDPVVFTSASDQPGLTPAAGDWNGLTLGSGASASVLRQAFVKYGAGLTLNGCAPTVDAFTALYNTNAGLALINGAMLNTTNTLLAYNNIGAQQLGASQLVIVNSDIKNNGTNALAAGGASLLAPQNWWGSAAAADVTAGVQGNVNTTGFLSSEPLLTPAIGTVGNVTQVGSQSVNLRLACRTADSMRLSEDSTFTAVFFNPFTNVVAFPLSAGGGQKTVFAQFRSLTGQTSAPVSLNVTYITAGPTIAAFSLTEGQSISRPLTVTGSASAPLGMADIEFYVDGVGQFTNTGGSFNFRFDPRGFSTAMHRVELLARDTSGNFATLDHNVVISPTPPPAPVITQPAADLAVNTNTISIAGTAEPLVQVNLIRSGSVLGTTNAAADGSFSFPNAALVEGPNVFNALAVDSLGSASSALRTVSRDTVPPAQLVFDTPGYTPGVGLKLSWHYPPTGKHATKFVVYWNTGPMTNITQAIGQSGVLLKMDTVIQGLPLGNYDFYVVGYDDIGNASPLSAVLPYYYDAVPPAFAVTFDKVSPVGIGPVLVTLTASEALANLPTLTVTTAGSSPALLPITNAALNTFQGVINVSSLLPSGPVQLTVAGQDLAGNTFQGPPSGPLLAIDVTPPAGAITTVPGAPVQATNSTSVAVSLRLTKAPKGGTTPALNFTPPVGAPVPVSLSGSGTNWSGSLSLAPAMGSGNGTFTLSVTDPLDNVGRGITSGSSLEIYNTALPTPPGQPIHFTATSLSGGRIQLLWAPVLNAEIYRVYSDPGSNQFATPVDLIADNISTNGYVDLPAADGYYLYSVTALRRGSEGTNSITRVALSDRVPPPAPTNVTLQLVAAGLQITWLPGNSTNLADHYNVYRNGALIRTVFDTSPIVDSPPKGVINYTVGAADSLGNEALSAPASIQLLVSAVNTLQALVNIGSAPVLNWTSSDSAAVGFNVYRNGIKQNATPLGSPTFTDTLPLAGQTATYAVTAVNATNAESAARTVVVYDVDLALSVNAAGSTASNPPVTTYFDDYVVTVTNRTSVGSLPLQQLEIRRLSGGAALTLTSDVNNSIGSGNWLVRELAVPGAVNVAPQSVRIRAFQQTDAGGSSVIYQESYDYPAVASAGLMISVSANQLPLAGGTNAFNVQIFNRGFAPMYFATVRGSGSQPGDLYISVLNQQGQEVGRTPFKGVVPGAIFDGGGNGYAMVPPGSSTTITVPGVLVPEALASNIVTFQAAVSVIYDRVTAGQQQAGPLSGSMQSALTQTPYYATAQTDSAVYYNDQQIVITGQALDRVTGQPVPNVPLKIGFATRGYRWYVNLTNDASGNYSYTYTPMAGLAGVLTIWAAHPDIYDQLNQAQATIYRFYASPATGDIRMSKNDTLDFSLQLINPSDLPLTGFSVAVQAYTMQGTNQVPTSKLHGLSLMPTNFVVGPNGRPTMNLRIAADADAPDNAVVVFTITSAEGATATFTGSVALLPANPLIAVVQPAVGYVEVALNRGSLLSAQLVIANNGLRDLQGVTLVPPTNFTWMSVNLPTNLDGTISLPDIAVGQSNSLTVVFAPPTNTALGFFQDKITVRGTNAVATFDLNLYARVTSANSGALQFYVDDILGTAVPNASVRLRNLDLQVELPPAMTDINGYVTVTNLQEGNWSWQITAPGYSSAVGTANVIASQVVQIAPPDTRLSRSLVTVNFTVVPVPFTDKYDIKIEQTFETHVPAPVLVLDPTYMKFDNIQGAFEANFTVTAKNYGLISLNNFRVSSTDIGGAQLTPLIEYLPYILPMQSVDIPFRVSYAPTNSTTSPSPNLARGKSNPCEDGTAGGFWDCVSGNWLQTACGVINLLSLAQGDYFCAAADRSLLGVAAGLMVLLNFYYAVLSPFDVVVSAFGCIVNWIAGHFVSGGGGGGGGGPGNGTYSGFGGDYGGCFAAETRVLLADGRFKTIDEIRPGDRVKTGIGQYHDATVRETHTRSSDRIREIDFAAVDSEAPRSIRATDEHLFWVDGKGWTEAQSLEPGQWLTDDEGRRVQILANRRVGGPLRVYTLQLADDTAFYANGVLVHDLCGKWSTNGPAAMTWPSRPTSPSPAKLVK